MSLGLLSCCPSTRDQVSACKQVCVQALRGYLGFQVPSMSLGQTDRVLTDSHSQRVWEFLFPAYDPWAVEPSVGPGPLPLQGGLPPPKSPSQCPLSLGLGSASFASAPLLPVSMWPLLYIISDRSSVQLVFR